ncbi:DUF922 domain-containing protein [Aliiglaciecola lipolytica]|uniref:Secreted Zn-dependent protease n=1 Tax=Aliiglaciecola lipolytica E3 TaxID=1127673 RepID=K6YC30_9ALTE|nr:DUF922 domain-containing protein [Aliiglaciecola lipolytica]GAC14203.1 hypothetical protein GLIP_1569 [Aliiglaciecola lipolytica E3]
MKFNWLVIAICSTLAATSITAYADVVLRERFEHYSIKPETTQQIKTELRLNSPVMRENQLFHGRTQWQLTPQFGLQMISNLCYLVDIRVFLDGIYTMPEMSNRQNTSVQLQQVFDDYYAALLEHEKGHQAIWIEAGETIERKLNSMTPHFQCSQLKHQATQRVARIVKQYQLQNKRYDQDTGHGRTQGAFIESQ